MTEELPIVVIVNGVRHERRVEARLLLSDFLRHELGLTGTHVGCEHGVCGACTVLYDAWPMRSCLMFAPQANGHEIETVESLSSGREPVDRVPHRKTSRRILPRKSAIFLAYLLVVCHIMPHLATQ